MFLLCALAVTALTGTSQERAKKKLNLGEEKMDTNDFNLIGQLVESMVLVSDELDKALGKKDVERTKRAKDEILKFQQQIAHELNK